MVNWMDSGPVDQEPKGLDLVRTPSTGAFKGIVTSVEVTGVETHFYKRRTIPHAAKDCEPCANKYPKRWHGYVSAIALPSLRHVLFEFTALSSEPFLVWQKYHDTIRGFAFRAQRAEDRANSRVVIESVSIDLAKFQMPTPPNVKELLLRVWGLPIGPAIAHDHRGALELLQKNGDRVHKRQAS